MTDTYYWRVRRNDNGVYEYGNSTTEPTVAFSDSGVITSNDTTKLYKVQPSVLLKQSIAPKFDSVNSTNFIRAAVFVYESTNYNLQNIKIISHMDSGMTSYTVRVRDATAETTMAETTLTNTAEQINDLGTLSNIPTTESIIEILVKRNGGNGSNSVYIDSVETYFN